MVAALIWTGPESVEIHTSHLLCLLCSFFKLCFYLSFIYRSSFLFSLFSWQKHTVYQTALGALTKSFFTHLDQICYTTNQWRVKMQSHLLPPPFNTETLQFHCQSFCILFYFCFVKVNELSIRSRDQLRLNVNPLFLC